jgi:hypothetical protein
MTNVTDLIAPETGADPNPPELRRAPVPASEDRHQRKDRRRREHRAERRDSRAGRRARRSVRERRNVPATLLAAAMLAVEVIVAAESFGGLVGFAHLIGIHGLAALGVPVTLDGIAIIASLLALRAELARESSGLYRLTLFAFTAASAAANAWHGATVGDLGTALYYGGMSLAVTWLFTLALRQVRTTDRRNAGMVTAPLPHFSGWHWARYPGRTYTAWSLAIRNGHETAAAALHAAELAELAKAARAAERADAAELARAAKAAAELPVIDLDGETLAGLSARDRLAVAFGALGKVDVPKALAMLAERGVPVDQSHAYQVRRAMIEGGAKGGDQS